MKRHHVIYHSADLDGHCSGLIAVKYLLEKGVPSEAIVLRPFDYKDDPEPIVSFISAEDEVIMLDVSMPCEYMERISELVGFDFIWIDHHKTAIDEMRDLDLAGSRLVGIAACWQAWKWFIGGEAPIGVKILAQYDVWDKEGEFDWERVVMPFQYYWKFRNTMPDELMVTSELLPLLHHGNDHYIASMFAEGLLLYGFQKRQCAVLAESLSHEESLPVEGLGSYKVICINSNVRNSMALDAVFDPNVHDFMCVYVWTGKIWILSFYHPDPKPKLDLGKIAKTFGGGGHKGAAGCQLKKLPW